MSKQLEKWKQAELDRLDQEYQEHIESQGYNPWVKWSKGDNPFKLCGEIPRVLPPRDGKQKYVFVVEVDGTLFDFSVNIRSPMYKDLLEHFGCEGILTRTGESANTKYEVRWPE